MDLFPFDLVLAVAVASATIFIGFLPTRDIEGAFFARETGRAALAWLIVAVAAPLVIAHYYVFLAVLCLAAWWNFRHGNGFAGKMWLMAASALGISVGVMFLLILTPRAYPAAASDLNRVLLLASLYLGGAVIGLAYAGYGLVRNSAAGSVGNPARGYVGLLLALVLLRPVVLLARSLSLPGIAFRPGMHGMNERADWAFFRDHLFMAGHVVEFRVAVGLSGIVLPCLAFAAWRAIRSGNRAGASRALAAVCLVGFAVEILVRFYSG